MKILTALDRSEYAEIVLEHALDRAARMPSCELHFVTAIGDDREFDGARAALEALVREGLDEFDVAARQYVLHVVRGRPVPAIGSLATQLPADLLVIGRFHVPTMSELLVEIIDVPTLVAGIDGVVLEPQCPACRLMRRATAGERLFCDYHSGDRGLDVVTRVPPTMFPGGAGMW